MKLLKKENWWIWLLLLLFSFGTSTLVLGALLDVFKKDSWYTKWYYWVIGLLCLLLPFLTMIIIFNIQILCLTAAKLDLDIPTTSIIKGDLLSITISAASVIAKVTRDRMLYEIDEQYPMYDLKNNKGYGTKKHIKAIEEYGIIKECERNYSRNNKRW